MDKTIDINIDGLKHINAWLTAMPEEANAVLRSSIRSTVKAAHREALIQISRRYTISMQATEKNLQEITSRGSPASAYLLAKGRRRRIYNFKIAPKKEPETGWTSSDGYDVEIVRGQKHHLSKSLFWVRTKNGPVLTSYKTERGRRGGRMRVGYNSPFSGLSTAEMLGSKEVVEKVSEVTKSTLEEVFARGMERRLKKEVAA